MDMIEKFLEMEAKIKKLEKEILALKKDNTKKHANNVTDTDIILIDTLNDEDKYKICIMSGNVMAEKVGD